MIKYLICFVSVGALIGAEKQDRASHEMLSDTDDFDARLEYVDLLLVLKKYPEAMQQLQILIKEGQQLPRVFLEMSKVYFYQKEYAHALSLLEDIKDPALQEKKGKLYVDILVAQKEFQKASAFLEEEIKEGRGNDRARLDLARVLSWGKEYQKSLEIYSELLEKRPDDIQLRRQYARVLFWAKEYEKSAEEWKKTLP